MIEEITNQITQKISSSPITIISAVIYGSWTRKEQTKDSDVDILLISNDINPKRQRRGKEIASIKGHLFFGYPFDILLLTPEECISNFENHNPLFLDIASEGIILKDTEDFIKNLMDETKRYIVQKGLIKHPDGWSYPVLFREATLL
jgi:predicted nucleotidyltransferase